MSWRDTQGAPPSRRECSIGGDADSYDNTRVETIDGLYMCEVIRRRGPWETPR
jgi:hypothetical protein